MITYIRHEGETLEIISGIYQIEEGVEIYEATATDRHGRDFTVCWDFTETEEDWTKPKSIDYQF